MAIKVSGVTVVDDSRNATLEAVQLGNWEIKADGDALAFYYNGTKQFKLGSNGLVTAKNDVVAFGTP
jgi:hypothetical protein